MTAVHDHTTGPRGPHDEPGPDDLDSGRLGPATLGRDDSAGPDDAISPDDIADPGDAHGRAAQLRALREKVLRRPDERATQAQWARGKLTARERIGLLLDPGSFHETEMLRRHRARGFGMEDRRPHTDGVVTGWGTVEGRTVFVYAHDFRCFGSRTICSARWTSSRRCG